MFKYISKVTYNYFLLLVLHFNYCVFMYSSYAFKNMFIEMLFNIVENRWVKWCSHVKHGKVIFWPN